jgi:hypothetical protein
LEHLAVTRWREDGTRDNRGSFCYIRELASGTVWSTAYQPTLKRPDHYEAIFSEGRAEFRRRDSLDGEEGEFETYTDIVVSPEDDIELRRTRITNRSRQRREIEVTSYSGGHLSAADELRSLQQPVRAGEILHERCAVLCSAGRSPPSRRQDAAPDGVHDAVSSAVSPRRIARVYGRTRSTASPRPWSAGRLSGTDGSVSILKCHCHRIVLEPGSQ